MRTYILINIRAGDGLLPNGTKPSPEPMLTYHLIPDSKVHGPTWGPPGSCRPQMGPMLAHEPCYQGCVPWHSPENSTRKAYELTCVRRLHFQDYYQLLPPTSVVNELNELLWFATPDQLLPLSMKTTELYRHRCASGDSTMLRK